MFCTTRQARLNHFQKNHISKVLLLFSKLTLVSSSRDMTMAFFSFSSSSSVKHTTFLRQNFKYFTFNVIAVLTDLLIFYQGICFPVIMIFCGSFEKQLRVGFLINGLDCFFLLDCIRGQDQPNSASVQNLN